MVLIDRAQRNMPFVVDGENLDRRKPVDREAMQPRQDAIASPGDVSTSAHLITTACGNGHTLPLEQVDVYLSQLLPGADAVTGSVSRQVVTLQQAQIQN